MKKLILFALFLGTAATAEAVTWGHFLRGHWVSDCSRSGLRAEYEQTGYTFSDFASPDFQMLIQTIAKFSDASCTKPLYFIQNLGKLSLKALDTDKPVKGTKISWQINPIEHFLMAFFSQDIIDDHNVKGYCGLRGWEMGKAKDLLKSTCQKDLTDYYHLNWFKMEVMSADQIQLSDSEGAMNIKRNVFKPVQ